MQFTPVIFVAILLIILWLVFRKKDPKEMQTQHETERSPFDKWVAEIVCAELAKKTELPHSALEKAFAGDPDAEVVSAIEAAVREIDLKFERLANGTSEVEVRATVRFEDGKTADQARRFPVDEIPAAVREDLDRTGASFAFRAWSLPWRS